MSTPSPRNVAAPVIDMLYPPGKSCRIPIIAVTGTNGKNNYKITSTYCKKQWLQSRFHYYSDGIYIQNHMMEKEILQVLKVHNMYWEILLNLLF
jgi:cyanophycin synthetase